MKQLYKSLAEFQREVPPILKATDGYGYKYADLSEIFRIIKPLLEKHQLGFYQSIEGTQLLTVVFHESGEKIESKADIPQGVSLSKMNPFQVMGSAITYFRRYTLSAMLGLVTDADIDASGEVVETKLPNPNPKQWAAILKKYQEGEVDRNKIEENFTLTKDQENELLTL